MRTAFLLILLALLLISPLKSELEKSSCVDSERNVKIEVVEREEALIAHEVRETIELRERHWSVIKIAEFKNLMNKTISIRVLDVKVLSGNGFKVIGGSKLVLEPQSSSEYYLGFKVNAHAEDGEIIVEFLALWEDGYAILPTDPIKINIVHEHKKDEKD